MLRTATSDYLTRKLEILTGVIFPTLRICITDSSEPFSLAITIAMTMSDRHLKAEEAPSDLLHMRDGSMRCVQHNHRVFPLCLQNCSNPTLTIHPSCLSSL